MREHSVIGKEAVAGVVGALLVLAGTVLCSGQTAEPAPPANPETVSAGERLPGPALSSISGAVVDPSGAAVTFATVTLVGEDRSLNQEVVTDDAGQFSFPRVTPGPFQLTMSAPGFATRTFSGSLHAGESYTMPPVTLVVAPVTSEVEVGLSRVEIAEEQLKVEEQQRLLRVFPNFYVSYVTDAAPLTAKQKFKLAWKSTVDPVTFVLVGATAGIEQAHNQFSGYGSGAEGYGKRYGANYADTVTGTFIGGAMLASLLKQDPRYFYKGTGSKHSRFLYAIASSVLCKGDNRRRQINYSGIIGGLAAGGISNLYYPASDRGAELTFENAAIGIGTTAVYNLFEEFFSRKMSSKIPKVASNKKQ